MVRVRTKTVSQGGRAGGRPLTPPQRTFTAHGIIHRLEFVGGDVVGGMKFTRWAGCSCGLGGIRRPEDRERRAYAYWDARAKRLGQPEFVRRVDRAMVADTLALYRRALKWFAVHEAIVRHRFVPTDLVGFRVDNRCPTPSCIHEVYHKGPCEGETTPKPPRPRRYTARAAFREQWPDHCRTCNGYGGTITTYDPSPAGVSLSPGHMTDFDPCEDCLGVDECPRCGQGIDPESEAVHACGWNPLSPEGLPEEWSCYGACFEAQERGAA